MESQGKQDTTIGNGSAEILPTEGSSNTEAKLKPAQTEKESGSIAPAQITPADLLSLLQSDCSELQKKGLEVILAGTGLGNLHIVIRWTPHKLGFDTGEITVDGQPVSELAVK